MALLFLVVVGLTAGCASLRDRTQSEAGGRRAMDGGTAGGTTKRIPPPSPLQHGGDGFVVIAHRGASGHAPENTMAAFRLAEEMRAEMIELDVMLTSDGVPVVFHDADLAKTTDAEGPLSTRTLDDLRQLEAGSWFSESFAGEPIPTLEQVLQWAAGRIALNIEIKTEAWRESIEQSVEPRVVELVRRHGMEHQVLFSSFDYRVVSRLKQLAPEIPTAVLYEKSQSEGRGPVQIVRDLGADAFNCSWRELTPQWMHELQEAGIPVFVYTVNDVRRMQRLIDQGVTGIFSDYPDVLLTAAPSAR